MNYSEAMKYINSAARFGSNLGLERTEKILNLLGDPHKQLKCIHVAGTNGKGSVCAMVAEVLIKNNYKTGLYTSPYLEEFEERIRINNENIDKIHLADCIGDVAKAIQTIDYERYGNPTEFEIITCAAFLYFFRMKVDYVVVEVGLGGRLDSTNVITPILSIITSISLDHMAILGDTISKIAIEKAGIIKNDVPVVLYPQVEEAELVFEEVSRDRHSKLIKVPYENAHFNKIFIEDGKYFSQINIKSINNIYDIKLGLLGKHQALNCLTAIFACEELNALGLKITYESIINSMKEVEWKGRLEVLSTKPLIIIDGAHNIDGIKQLTESLELFPYEKIHMILGILRDKQYKDMIRLIGDKCYSITTVTPHNTRAESSQNLRKECEKYCSKCNDFDSYEEAFMDTSKRCNERDLLLVCGSLYMVGDMRKVIKKLK